MRPKVIHTIEELRTWRATQDGSNARAIGFVPTMGALHAGHASLLRKSRELSETSVLSIFVNPTQFGPNEDFAKYPRTLERDLEIAAQNGVDVVFAPAADAMYSPAHSTWVEETELTRPLCGTHRPGHFRGVTTVVLKLLNLIRPDVALFGLKDAQQFFVLHKMASDLNLNVRVEGVRTIRESDGLALSSRNVYLSPEERKVAPLLQKTLLSLAENETTREQAIESLNASGFRVQYLEELELPNLSAVTTRARNEPRLIAAAAYLGATRLIDNVIVRPELLKEHGIVTH